MHNDNEANSQEKADLSLGQLRDTMRRFVAERDWQQFHTPRNLLLALVGEVGELAEIYQWAGQVKPGLEGVSEKDRQRTKEEVADVLAYLIRFSDVAGIDLSQAFLEKMEKNSKKYPKDLVKGSSAKYTQYRLLPQQ